MQILLAFDSGCNTPQRWGAGYWNRLLLNCFQLMQAALKWQIMNSPTQENKCSTDESHCGWLSCTGSSLRDPSTDNADSLPKENSTRPLPSVLLPYRLSLVWKETTTSQSNRSNEEYRKHTNKVQSQELLVPERTCSVISAPFTSSHFLVFSDAVSWKIRKYLMEFSQPLAVSSINFHEHCRW